MTPRTVSGGSWKYREGVDHRREGVELGRERSHIGTSYGIFLQILDDSRLLNFALDCKIVNCIDVLYRFDKDRSVYRLAHI